LPAPIRSHVWTDEDRAGFAERQARDGDLQRRIEALPDPEIDDPFVGIHGGPLSLGLANGGGKR
jgi:hypothetical protein